MAVQLRVKNKATPGAVPPSLLEGEIAVNTADAKLWVGNAANEPVQLAGPERNVPAGGTTGQVLEKTSATDYATQWASGYAKTGVVNAFTRQQHFAEVQLTDGTNINWNLDTAQVARVTLTGSPRTMNAPTNLKAGATYILRVIQDGSGNRTLAWNTVFKWPGGSAPSLTTAPNKQDIFTFYCDGTNMYGTSVKNY